MMRLARCSRASLKLCVVVGALSAAGCGASSDQPAGEPSTGGAQAAVTGSSGAATGNGGKGGAPDTGGTGQGQGNLTGGGATASGGALGVTNTNGGTNTTAGGASGSDATSSVTGSAGGGPSCPATNPASIPQPIKVDLDMAGRPESEVNEVGYTAWPIEAAPSISRTIDGVGFSFSSVGANGTGLKSDWSKTLVQAPYYARLANDGLTVDGGEAGAAIELVISGLEPGPHTLVVYHNNTQNPANNSFAPIDISLNGNLIFDDLEPSVQAEANSLAKTSYLEFDAQADQSVTVRFSAETTSLASNKNVMLNGFLLDAPDPTLQAKDPVPAHRDEHVDADDGALTLSWAAAEGATRHLVYFGENFDQVAGATTEACEFRGEQSKTSYDVGGLVSNKTYYWRVDEVGADGVITRGDVWDFRPRHLAFPGAQGYGRFARGGRGGSVVHVTNLNDSGPGSLRDAVENESGPRTIVFDVGGVIRLSSRLSLIDNYVTVAGQTAPGKGVVVRGAPFGLSGARDIIIRHVRVRLGAGPTFDGMGMAGSDHSIIDHASISWTIDEAFSSRNAKNITLQRTLISECLNVAGHENYPEGTAHGYAASISGDLGSFHHNLLAHCEGRNWSLAGGLDGDGNFAGRLDIFNNVVYNWGHRTTDGGAHEVNFVNNYYEPGPASSIFVALNAQYESFPGTQRYYFAGNVMPGTFDETNQSAGRQYTGTPDGYSPWVDEPFFVSFATIDSAGEAYKSVLSDVGCNQPVFDDHDARVVRETLSGTTTYQGSETGLPGLPDHENDVGGYEDYPTTTRAADWDSDADGLPDFWESQLGLDPESAPGDFSDSNADPDGDGYTRLDDYLEWMAIPHAFVTLGANWVIDLPALFAGYASGASYTSENASGLSVSIAQSTATVTPSACGFASADLSVTDSTGASMTRHVSLFVDGC